MGRFERMWRRTIFFISALIKTASYISIVITILMFLGIGSAFFGYSNHALPLIIIGTAVFILSILVIIFLHAWFEEKTNINPNSTNTAPLVATGEVKSIPTDTITNPPPEEEDVEILLEELVYKYGEDGQTMHQRKRFIMRALRDGIEHYIDRYRWSGHGKCDVKLLTSGFNITNERRGELGSYFQITVTFPHRLLKGEEVDFTIEWELFDENKAAIPFLSTRIYRETKHLSMRVMLPPQLAPKHAHCYEFSHMRDDQPLSKKNTLWSPATQCISYEIPFPKKYHKYLISWQKE